MKRIQSKRCALVLAIILTVGLALSSGSAYARGDGGDEEPQCPPDATVSLTRETTKELRGVNCEVALGELQGRFAPCSDEKRGNEAACRQYCQQGEAQCEGVSTTPVDTEVVGCTERTETFEVTVAGVVTGSVSETIATITCGSVITDCTCIGSSFIFRPRRR